MTRSKIAIVAKTEFGNTIRSKALIISLVLMPVFMGGAILVQYLTNKSEKRVDRTFAVLDLSGALGETLLARVDEYNADAADGEEHGRYGYIALALDGRTIDEVRLAASDDVRSGKLFAYLEIPADVFEVEGPPVRYHSLNPAISDLRRWFGVVINEKVTGRRFEEAGIPLDHVRRLQTGVKIENLNLVERAASGEATAAAKVDQFRTMGVPFVLMMLVFAIVMMTGPQLLNSVLEEKMNRVSEVMLGSVTAFELMMGKLVGTIGVSLVLMFVYLGGAWIAASYAGYADVLTPEILSTFLFLLVAAMFLYGSMFAAIGSACSEMRDAQSMMMPAMLFVMIPLFVWMPVLQNPNGTLAVSLSLFPMTAPMIMIVRMATDPGPPLWQLIVVFPLMILATIGGVWVAARIFRVGLLMQGKAPTFREMFRWVRAK